MERLHIADRIKSLKPLVLFILSVLFNLYSYPAQSILKVNGNKLDLHNFEGNIPESSEVPVTIAANAEEEISPAAKDEDSPDTTVVTPVLVTPEMRKNFKSTPLTPEQELEINKQRIRSRDFHSFAGAMSIGYDIELRKILDKQYLSCQKSVRDYYADRDHAQMLPMCDLLRDRYLQKLSEVKAPFPEEVKPTKQIPHTDPKQTELK